jgi:hypothetical protein
VQLAGLDAMLVDLLGEGSERPGLPTIGTELERVIAGVRRLAAQLTAARAAAEEQGRRLGDIMEMISALVSFDYTQRARVGDDCGRPEYARGGDGGHDRIEGICRQRHRLDG